MTDEEKKAAEKAAAEKAAAEKAAAEKAAAEKAAAEKADLKGFNAKWLKDLTFSGSKSKIVEEDGMKKIRHFPFTRQMTEADVLDFRVDGSEVVIVSKDGKKYRIKK